MEKWPAVTRRNVIRLAAAVVSASVLAGTQKFWSPYARDTLDFLYPSSVESPRQKPITLDARGSYTFISAGDSLAAGYQGVNGPDGVPESWVGPMVQRLNTVRQEIFGPRYTGSGSVLPNWRYVHDSALSIVNATSSNLLNKLRDPNTQETLSTFDQATLCITLGFNDLFSLLNGNALSLLGDRHPILDEYQQNLEQIVASFKTARSGEIERSACIVLGLPNLDAVPAVQRAVHGTPLEGRAGLVASEMNQRMAAVCGSESAIPMAYIDIFNHESIKPAFVSPDGLHPNANGYRQIGTIAANELHIALRQAGMDFTPEPKL